MPFAVVLRPEVGRSEVGGQPGFSTGNDQLATGNYAPFHAVIATASVVFDVERVLVAGRPGDVCLSFQRTLLAGGRMVAAREEGLLLRAGERFVADRERTLILTANVALSTLNQTDTTCKRRSDGLRRTVGRHRGALR